MGLSPILVARGSRGGAILGFMEFARRKWRIASAVDPIEANALRGGRLFLRDYAEELDQATQGIV
jgi:hypothetical protein